MVEIKSVFNKVIEHVVDICENTLEKTEKSQEGLTLGLDELERRLKAISQLNERLNDNKLSEACQNIQIYKAKVDRIKLRLTNVKRRISNIETKVSAKVNQ